MTSLLKVTELSAVGCELRWPELELLGREGASGPLMLSARPRRWENWPGVGSCPGHTMGAARVVPGCWAEGGRIQ